MDPAFRWYYVDALLALSLRRGAPMDVLETLVQLNDGLLPEDAILSLSERGWAGAARAVEMLGPFGLDVHHVDEFGRNAFSKLAGTSNQSGDAGASCLLFSQFKAEPSTTGELVGRA